ncbi:MAG: hypothetical protein ACI9FG_000789 [Crocinitomicaceae bacterium]|jgi:hypothetical protein
MKLLPLLSVSALAVASLTLSTSCRGTVGIGSTSNAFASTQINNSSRSIVESAIRSVFREDGFSLVSQSGNTFQFQKWGGRSTEVVYGTWFTDGVAVEPEVEMVVLGDGNYAVLCDVYMREHGSSLNNANHRLLASGKLAYNGMMRKVKKRAEGK